MGGLAAPFANFAFGAKQAVHRWHRAQIAALVQQGGVDGRRRLVHEALVVQQAEHLGLLT